LLNFSLNESHELIGMLPKGIAMSIETKTELEELPDVQETIWSPPSPPADLVFDDGKPLETNRHRIAMNVLIDSALSALAERANFFCGGNMFVYYSRVQAMNRDFRGPDFFVVLDIDGSRERQGWVTWEEEGRYPDVIIELMSSSMAKIDKGVKKELYERTFRTPDYYIYDPFDPQSLQGWHLDVSQRYQPLSANEHGWLGTWPGSIRREPPIETCQWLRFYDGQENLILLPEEAERQRADAAQSKAERLAARLRELGVDPNSV